LSELAVVIATRDRPEMLDRCLASVRNALPPGEQLVVVDSASLDEAAVAAVARRHGALLVRAPEPGVNLARNLGWRATDAPLVLFTDDDVEVEPGWAKGFRDGIAEHAFASGALGARGGTRRVAVHAEPYAVLTLTSPAFLGHGASTAVTRSALEAVGGWDECLGSGSRFRSSPEADLYDRLLAAGLTGVNLPAVQAWHHQWRTDREVARLQLNYAIGLGARLSKLLRTDRRRLRVVARDVLWGWGLRALLGAVRRREPLAFAAAVVRLGGYAWGFAIASACPVVEGHFRPRP
jgi:glycosyltransferase involved in cell wall biosynthesis